ncbi:hypothetical protein [Myroides odoratus]|uniref:hypothetical protein n=1 Tax=Myroides odoratus TaxID=256 RepID=UPI0039B0E10F
MNVIKLFRVYLILFLIGLLPLFGHAQVTIGSGNAPEEGALLQLKNLEPTLNSSINSNKGLLMPRVWLTSIDNLFPMFPSNYSKIEEDTKHSGLLVFNINEMLPGGNGIGMYVWDGVKWIRVGKADRIITVTPTKVYVSPINQTATAQMTIEPADSQLDVGMGVGNSSSISVNETTGLISITRSATEFGNKEYTFTLRDTNNLGATLEVCNLELKLAKEMLKTGENTEMTSSVIEAYGGDADWTVVDYSRDVFTWNTAPQNRNGKLYFEMGPASRIGNIDGFIKVAHINDPTFTKILKIRLNKNFVILPPFDYLVVQYVYQGGGSNYDLDTATEINNTGIITIDKKAVGYGLIDSFDPILYIYPNTVPKQKEALVWGGDNVRSGYETTYINMPNVKSEIPANSTRREFNIDMYAIWYNGSGKDVPSADKLMIDVIITAYRGGKMVKVNTYDFKNVDGGEQVGPVLSNRGMRVAHAGTVPQRYRTLFEKLLRLEYDRVDNTGFLTLLTQEMVDATRNMSIDEIFYNDHAEEINAFQELLNESKEAYLVRFNQFIEALKIEKANK